MIPAAFLPRLEEAHNIWVATSRPGGQPHLVPVWFTLNRERLFCCVEPDSVKAKNLTQNPLLSLALEDGSHPLICEGEAIFSSKPWPESVVGAFSDKYDWDISTEERYCALLEIVPHKWLNW